MPKPRPKRWMIVYGSINNGFDMYGPFGSSLAALIFAQKRAKLPPTGPWWVVQLKNPLELIAD